MSPRVSWIGMDAAGPTWLWSIPSIPSILLFRSSEMRGNRAGLTCVNYGCKPSHAFSTLAVRPTQARRVVSM